MNTTKFVAIEFPNEYVVREVGEDVFRDLAVFTNSTTETKDAINTLIDRLDEAYDDGYNAAKEKIQSLMHEL